jgi:hypothetical protein
MRYLSILSCLVVAGVAFGQDRAAAETLEKAVLGSWRSEDLGLDFPIWMVDTYAADGTVRTDFYSKPKGKEIHHKDKTTRGNWRIRDGGLEVGKLQEDGTFKREGQPRRIQTDSAGKVVSIGGWTRVKKPETPQRGGS